MIEFHIATLFPDMVRDALSTSMIGRAQSEGLVKITCHNIRDYTLSKQRRTDDAPYGGGFGMVMQADPIFRCFEAVCELVGRRPHSIYLTPQGRVFDQGKAMELREKETVFLLCGHYEGVDERVLEEIIDEEISIGDFVLTGGEIAAMAVTDAVCRLIPGVLADETSYLEESHSEGTLEYPHYTHPRQWHDKEVPEVLLSGHHENIRLWRRRQSLLRTLEKRPDLFEKLTLSEEDKKLLE